MTQPVAGLNPQLLTWARQRAGMSVEDVARALNKDAAVIRAWEEGNGAPTYVQLETLAYRIYKRPIAVFFFPDPPAEPDPEHSFRTLPEFELHNLSADTRYRVRKARALQLSLFELNDGRNPAERPIFRDIRVQATAPAANVAARVRLHLGVDLQDQSAWRSTRDAFKEWRTALETAGIYVFKDTFKQKDVSGFCLMDDEFPLIYINNSTPFSRQIFTAFHEVGHIVVQMSGMTKRDDRFIDALSGLAKEVEVFCNRFAAEVLVPSTDFHHQLAGRRYADTIPEELAAYYKVSREVILRKFLDRGEMTASFYRDKVQEWADESEAAASEVEGGNYYATQATYLGDRYLRLAFSRYYQGRCSFEELADYLNVKASSVPGLEPFGLR